MKSRRGRGRFSLGAPLVSLALMGLAAVAPETGGAGQTGLAPAAETAALAEVVSEPVEVGAVFELEIVVEHPEGAEAAPVVEESLGDFRVMGAAPLEGDEDRPGESRFRLRLGAFVLPGDHEIPGVPIGIRTADGELSLIETPPAPVRVVSALPPDAGEAGGDIHDIRGPFELSVPPRWGQIGLLALALLAVVAAAAWWWRRRGAREAPVVPLPPPAAEAEAALAQLARAGLLESGEVVAYYDRLAGIMKRYAGRRFESPWSERTTGEILRDLRDLEIRPREVRARGVRARPNHREALVLLAAILGEADLAKFSEQSFRPAAAEARFREAGMFLDRTRPSLPSEALSSEALPSEGDAGEGPTDTPALPAGSAPGSTTPIDAPRLESPRMESPRMESE